MLTTPALRRAASWRAGGVVASENAGAEGEGTIVGARHGFVVVADGDHDQHGRKDVFVKEAVRRA